MQVRNIPPFLPMKKSRRGRRVDDADSQWLLDVLCLRVFMASISGADREYRRPLVRNVPSRSSIVVGFGRCGGIQKALSLLTLIQYWGANSRVPHQETPSSLQWLTDLKIMHQNERYPWLHVVIFDQGYVSPTSGVQGQREHQRSRR